jgi:hypothetical protein
MWLFLFQKIGNISWSIQLDIATLLNIFYSTLVVVTTWQHSKFYRYSFDLIKTLQGDKPTDKLDGDVLAILNEMQKLTDCDRVVVGLFVSGADIKDVDKRFMTVQWEIVDKNITPTKFKYLKVPLSKIKAELELCLKNTTRFAVTKLESTSNEDCTQYLKMNNIGTVYSRILDVNKQGFGGIINIQYSRTYSNVSLNGKFTRLDAMFNQLEDLLLKNRII